MRSLSFRQILAALMAFLVCAASPAVAQGAAPLAQTPPMGWNSWNRYGCRIDESLIRGVADAMVANGMRDAGYTYVNIDDCWQGERDKDGFIQADPARFPSGIKALADYVHVRGLKLGIYSDAGAKTCGGRAGSQGHEFQDATQYARWGVDYLKYDWCNTGTGAAQRNPREAYATMRAALDQAGRAIVFSICEWGDSKPWEWAAGIGNLWRTTGDIANCWSCKLGHGSWNSLGVMEILDKQEGLRRYAGPGHWNDPDMLEVGNLTDLNENRSHFAMWAMLAAPLIVGADIAGLKPEITRILTNPRLVAIDQDTLGIQGFAWQRGSELEIWARPLSGQRWAIAALNRSSSVQNHVLDWTKEPLGDDLTQTFAKIGEHHFNLIDAWTGKRIGDTQDPLPLHVAPRDAQVFILEPKP
ncbi:glycoside hydrolase family 27 protein [Novosphingobium sp. SG707]|uniref:glycoside hydrolase family 27 protein n=1 Tax=Novosphingobium sp. SG707 TaxID=2586996 RepID=UPI001795749A|nr:alpha-galactosidase [Novosphingobium sp. SG707]